MFGLNKKSTFAEAAPSASSSGQAQIAALNAVAEQSLSEARRELEVLQQRMSGEFGQTVELSVNMSELLCLMAWGNGNVRKLSGETVAISGAVEEMARTIQNIAELSEGALGGASEAAALVENGAGRAQNAGRAMSEISVAFSGLDERMKMLGEATESIGGFAKEIENISSQTKLLALNATIEAARAGEAGRGFAVVAAEVKALSEETSKTTELIRGQLTTLADVMQSMIQAMQIGGSKVRDGQSIFDGVLSDMEGIRTRMSEVNGSIGSITHMLSDQHQASDSIAKSLSEIARLASQNETDSRSAADLIDKADKVVERLLDGAVAADAAGVTERRLRADHMIWKRNLAEALVGLKPVDARTFAAGNAPLGDGLERIKDPAVTNLPAFRALRPIVDTLVRESNKMVQELSSGNMGKAIEHYMAMDGASGEVMGKLMELSRALGYPNG